MGSLALLPRLGEADSTAEGEAFKLSDEALAVTFEQGRLGHPAAQRQQRFEAYSQSLQVIRVALACHRQVIVTCDLRAALRDRFELS